MHPRIKEKIAFEQLSTAVMHHRVKRVWVLYECGSELKTVAVVVGVSRRMEWLLELMGLIRNVAYGATTLSCGDRRRVRVTPVHLYSRLCDDTSDKFIRTLWLRGEPGAKPLVKCDFGMLHAVESYVSFAK